MIKLILLLLYDYTGIMNIIISSKFGAVIIMLETSNASLVMKHQDTSNIEKRHNLESKTIARY